MEESLQFYVSGNITRWGWCTSSSPNSPCDGGCLPYTLRESTGAPASSQSGSESCPQSCASPSDAMASFFFFLFF